MLGRKVTIVEMLDKINDSGNFQHTKSLKVELKKYDIGVTFSTKALEITDKGVRCSTPDNEKFFKADTSSALSDKCRLIPKRQRFGTVRRNFIQLGIALHQKISWPQPERLLR